MKTEQPEPAREQLLGSNSMASQFRRSIIRTVSHLTPESEDKPAGIQFLEWVWRTTFSFRSYQAFAFIVTFVAYTSFHATRKTISVVKSTLSPQPPNLGSITTFTGNDTYIRKLTGVDDGWTPFNRPDGWAPFNGPDGTVLLGELDLAFLSTYALGMYFAGHLGDRANINVFLTLGMIGTGVFTALFGIAFWAQIHHFLYFLVIQLIAGLFQSTGWPSVVAVAGNWFDKSKRGLIMGVWNAHTSVGNITGSLIASSLLKFGWGWSFVVPGLLIALLGPVVLMFMPVSPMAVGVERDGREWDSNARLMEGISGRGLSMRSNSMRQRAVGFFEAWKIPGVASFALCLFFAKLVAYTFLYWLPFYVSHTVIGGEYLSDETAGNLSTIFDLGGVVGGVLAGFISDQIDARAITAAAFMYLAIPALFFYRIYGQISLPVNVILMFISGMFVNAPYALITTAVSADLGTHNSLQGNARALATVTAIIDGTGSVGAAVGPILTGYVSAISWNAVFFMLMGAAFVAGLLLTRLVIAEVVTKMSEPTDEVSRPPLPPAREDIPVIDKI